MAAGTGIGTVDSRSSADLDGGVRIIVACDVLLYREGLVALLRRAGGLRVVGSVESPGEAAKRLRDDDADVVLVALGTQNTDAVRALVAAAPDVRMVVVAPPEGPEDVIALAELGVLGYVTREQSLSDLRTTIESVARGEMSCAPWIATLLVRRVQELASDRPMPVDRLTPREAGILQLVADGLSNREIASRLHIELTTVKNHVHNILDKLGARTRAEAVALMGLQPSVATNDA